MEENKVEEIVSIDDVVLNQAYYHIKSALFEMEVLDKTSRNLCLGKEITPEFKKQLKKDMEFTSHAVKCLTQAAEGYKKMTKNLELLEGEMDKHVMPKVYDIGQACVFDLCSLDMVYLTLSNQNQENEVKIHKFLIENFEWTEDLKRVYKGLRDRVNRMNKTHKD